MDRKNACLCLVILIAFSATSFGQAQPQVASRLSNAGKSGKSSSTMDTGQQMTNIPYFSQEDGMRSVLTLNNNTTAVINVSVTIFNKAGSAFMAPMIALTPGATDFSLRSLIKNAPGDFSSGNIEVMYVGGMMAVTCQVGVFGKRISFESREQDMMDFLSTKMNGIVWRPDAASKAFVALTNTASKTVHVNVSVGGDTQALSLKSRETRLVKLDKESLREGPGHDSDTGKATLLQISHDGAPGDIIGTGFVLNPETGYSSDFNLVDPATSRTAKLAGAGIRFGYADVTEGFPVGTMFRAPLVIANVGQQTVNAIISVDFTIAGNPTSFPVTQRQVKPGELKVVELAEEMKKLGVSGPVEDAGVDISYDGEPGSLIGHLTSVDQTGDYALFVPIKDPQEISHTSGNTYPWTLKNGNQTVLHLKNTTDKPVWVIFQIRFAGGTYSPERMQLQPFQSVAVNLQQLKDSQRKDISGHLLPENAVNGQVEWIEETHGSMIGRAEQVNISAGTDRSFSCGGCPCYNDFYQAYLTPTSVTASVGTSGTPFYASYQTVDCDGNPFGPYAMPTAGWNSSNSSVTTVNGSGYCSYVGAGTANISAWMNYDNYYWTGPYNGSQCVAEPFTPQTGPGTTTVKPKITSPNNTVWWFNGQNPSSSTYPTTITLTASGGSSATWNVTNGAQRVNLSPSGNQTTVTSSGSYWSGAVGDISITATINGQTSPAFTLTSRRPWKLVSRGAPSTMCFAVPVSYQSTVSYDLHDNLDTLISTDVGWNEVLGAFTSENGSNWGNYTFSGFGAATNPVEDILAPPDQSAHPELTPYPTCSGQNLGTTRYRSIPQTLRVGSNTNGSGVQVQTDTLGYYKDHGQHDSITVPSQPQH